MHKGIIILVKTSNKDEALEAVKEFLLAHKEDVWDWYQIGGRWHNILAPMCDEFFEKKNSILGKSDLYSIDLIEEKQNDLQKLWVDLGGKGYNPFFSQYNLSENGDYYDVLPLSECILKVKEWVQTVEDVKEKKAYEWLNKEDVNGEKYDDWWNYLKIATDLYQQAFCFNCNVFNIEACNYSIPEDVENYFAVMIDIHN